MGRLIKQGCKGADVRAVQDVLNFHVRRLALWRWMATSDREPTHGWSSSRSRTS